MFFIFFSVKHFNLIYFFFCKFCLLVKSLVDCSVSLPSSSFISFFLFLLVVNFCYFGYFRYSICVCRYIEFTFFLALSFWFSSFLFFIRFEKFSVYLSKGGDSFLKSLSIMIIELVSEFSRPIALTVRLTVNITVGHLLIIIIYSFSESSGSLFYILFLLFSIFIEFFVFLIQSYIFSRLVYLYLNE